MKNSIRFIVLLLFIYLIPGCVSVTEVTVYEKSYEFRETFKKNKLQMPVPPSSKIDTILIDDRYRTVKIFFNRDLSYIPYRKENVAKIYSAVKDFYGENFSEYSFSILTIGKPIEELIPNFYRERRSEYDKSRIAGVTKRPEQIIKNISKLYEPVNGLTGRNILVWPSHGWYYNNKAERWMWQRARLFQVVEDLGPYAFIIPYLAPMLESAGANVFMPRERDTQQNEVIIDDMTEGYGESGEKRALYWGEGEGEGFGKGYPPYKSGVNPFKLGKHRITFSETKRTAEASWVPDIPETGEYSVYISFNSSPDNIDDAHYTVYYLGGSTEFLVNQQIGGGTWLHLGKFKFSKGKNFQTGRVTLTNESKHDNRIISADAVRFGGGMGIIERGGSTSNRPKFVEGSRYWLQFAGMPDTLVYNLNADTIDYNDDYQSRAEYGNYLYGDPFGPSRGRNVKGLGIPIDLSLAFHTDAGIRKSDTTVGTLSIYSVESIDTAKNFPDNVSRFANRDLADIVQTEIVKDIRSKYDPVWNRRWLWNAKYSEAARPNYPSMLLELLSHQNFLDTKFSHDPRFRFDISRSIYKGMLKFLSAQYNFDYIVQPLPVTHFSVELINGNNALLKWKPQTDPLEPTAEPDKYIVYTRIDDEDFDNGVITKIPEVTFYDLKQGVVYSFKICAVNSGGEGFPSEILSVCNLNNGKEPVLIVNGFDRICGPASVQTDLFTGFLNDIDTGVPDKFDLSYTGKQYNFNPDSKWFTDDDPGFGASHSDFETKIIAGNSFDFPFVHGQSIKKNGYSFVSSSDEAVWDSLIDISKYNFIDLILGEEKQTHWQKPFADSVNGIQFKTFPEKFQKVIEDYLKSGGNIFISGAYVASDLFANTNPDSSDMLFARNILKFSWSNNYADKTGEVYSIPSSFSSDTLNLEYNTKLNDSIYAVEAPDALYPFGGSETIFRYYENSMGAGIGYKKDYGVVVLGFPFETILGMGNKNILMNFILKYLLE
jgi:hypothetical protein